MSDFSPASAAVWLDHLLGSPPCTDAESEVRRLGLIIDLSEDSGRIDGLMSAVEGGERMLRTESLAPRHSALVHYFLSNAWDAKRRLAGLGWQLPVWEHPDLEKQVVHLRRAARLATAGEIETARVCQIHTNLGNLMDHCGRFVEAIASWDTALRHDPAFGMAHGNRGYALFRNALLIHDPGHQLYYLREAHRAVEAALRLADSEVYPDAEATFQKVKNRIEKVVPSTALSGEAPSRDFAAGWTKEERTYREWCLRNRLFLNDLNDLALGAIAAADVLTLPSLTTAMDAPLPSAMGFFNQLKQEFASARYLYFDGIQSSEVHFSDRDVKLINTLDYPSYGLPVEKIKLAFRVAYSIFDKIAYFLNDYLALKIPETRVTFRKIWYEKGEPKKGIRQDLCDPRNLGMKGLFWLAKDLHESAPEFTKAIEPDAQEIASIRNHIEHKYFKLHTLALPPERNMTRIGFEPLGYSLARSEFEAKTLRLLQLARSALVYLVHAVSVEELGRRPAEGTYAPVLMDNWDDDWKV